MEGRKPGNRLYVEDSLSLNAACLTLFYSDGMRFGGETR